MAASRGYEEVLEPTDPTVDASKADNNKAYNDLILSINDEVTFGIADKSNPQLILTEMREKRGRN